AARLGAGEDDVLHALAAQPTRRLLAHAPAHRIDHVGLAAPVGADDCGDAGPEAEHRTVDERLEAADLEGLDSQPDLGLRAGLGPGGGRGGLRERGAAGILGGRVPGFLPPGSPRSQGAGGRRRLWGNAIARSTPASGAAGAARSEPQASEARQLAARAESAA